MKKLILSFFIFFFLGVNAYSQCSPDTTSQPGFYPNCNTGFPDDTVGVAYSTVLQARIPATIMYGSLTATVDSFVLINVTGLPSGFTYSTNPTSKSFPGGSNACLSISGPAPTSGMTGTYSLSINFIGYGKVFGTSTHADTNVTCYSIRIDPAITGIAELNNTKFNLSQNSPDPATKYTNIYYSLPTPSKVDFKIYNLLGKVVYQKSFFGEAGSGKITLDAQSFSPGIYMYNLSNGKATLTKRMVIAYN